MATVESSTFKSFIRPSSFWSKSKVKNSNPAQINDGYFSEKPTLTTHNTNSSSNLLPSFGKKAVTSSSSHNIALKETALGEVYKLSMIEDGTYMPPSPGVEGKRDHWVDVREDIMDFNLPDYMCLTTQYNEKHDFFTPYTFVQTQPYVLPVSELSDSSSDNDSSLSRSSSIY